MKEIEKLVKLQKKVLNSYIDLLNKYKKHNPNEVEEIRKLEATVKKEQKFYDEGLDLLNAMNL